MFHGKPIIGITGGIGSGKSFVARLFGELGCAVLDADAQVRAAYNLPEVRNTIRQWWGDQVIKPDGSVDRRAIAREVFSDSAQRLRLEGLLHPIVTADRKLTMEKLANVAQVVAFVWDVPLLFEVGSNSQCDAVVFVDAPSAIRLERVARERGWDEGELKRRENLQWPLDTKREISDYVIENTADAGEARGQVRAVLSRILERASHCQALSKEDPGKVPGEKAPGESVIPCEISNSKSEIPDLKLQIDDRRSEF
jgi:dephospho-CoA kinase